MPQPGTRPSYALTAFAQGLRQHGYVEDRNISIQYSWANGHYDLLPLMAAEFVRRRVAVIAMWGPPLPRKLPKRRHRPSRLSLPLAQTRLLWAWSAASVGRAEISPARPV
jgi:hypothetical protein